ncbi:MAG: type II secretion system protein [Elusimicrobia bacterium]|nr:type II secretion system protein [Elusimicrobiota bacterium]
MSRSGFVLVEVTIAYVILVFALVALVPVFIIAIRAGANTEALQTATYLSNELMEEVRMRRWDERTPASGAHISAPSTLGRDGTESATDKRTFDDVDDFNGWTEGTPMDPVMRALPDFKAYRRSVAVAYVDSAMAASVPVTDYKMITVCTTTAKISPTCLSTMVTNR